MKVRESRLPVQGHEDEGVYGDKSRGHYEELVHLAPEITKRPGRGEGIICSGEGNTDQQEQNVGNLGLNVKKLEYLAIGTHTKK